MGPAPAGDQIQQGGFARAIGANDADAIFWAEVVAEGLQQGGAAGRAGLIGGPHRQVFRFDRPLAQPPLVAGQADLALGLPFGGLLHGLDALDAGLLFGAAGLGAPLEPLQLPPQGPLELHLAGGRGGFFLRLAGQVVGVIAAVAAGFAAIHLHDPAGHLVEHVAVVGDQHQGAAEALQIALQPLDAVGVEVVGGLIQQQHVGLGHQGGGQGQALAVAAGEFPHLALGVADAEPIEHLADLLLQVPGLALVHAGIEAAQFRQQGRVVAALGMGMAQGIAQGRVAAQQLHLFAAFGEHLFEHRALRIHLRFLAHQHDAGLAKHPPLAGAGGLQARQQPHQGALARPIGANQPQPLLLPHVQGEVVEQGADAEVLADSHQADQAHALEGWR